MLELDHSYDAVAKKIIFAFKNADNPSQLFILKSFLNSVLESLPNDGTLPAGEKSLTGFRVVQKCLYLLREHRPNLHINGVIWRGRPDFLTDDLLKNLQNEVTLSRSKAFRQRWGQYVSAGGDLVKAFAQSSTLRYFAERHFGSVLRSSYASCLYYDEPGASIHPHVDTDIYPINLNLILTHMYSHQKNSYLVVYPLIGDPEFVDLHPGELLLFHADCVVHCRTPISDGELVHAISFGFQPVREISE